MATLTPAETRRRVDASLRRRYRTEWLFRFYGLVSVLIGVGFLVVLFTTIIGNGYGAAMAALRILRGAGDRGRR
jgi:phosphate transport system permease protein